MYIWLNSEAVCLLFSFSNPALVSTGWSVSDSITISSLAIRVYTTYQYGPQEYRHILEDLAALRILIGKVAQHLESTPANSVGRRYGLNVLKSCQSVLEDLDSFMEGYKRRASTNKKLGSLGKKPIVTLRERLISSTILLNGFARRFVAPVILLH